MSQKRIILSDSSLNRYGYRVLTSGMLLEAFKKNPVMLYMHFRDEGSPIWGETKAIGHWEDIQLEGDVLSAIPVFDKVDQLSKDIAAKYEAGTYNAASVGIRIIATSANKDLLVPGQTRETVTESELMEASKNGLERIVNAADNLKFLMENAKTEAITDAEAENFAKTEEFVAGFEKAMDDDFNTADAVAAIFDLVKYINTTTDAESSKEYLQKLFDLLVKLTGVLGLIVDKKEEILDEDIEKLIEERQAARKAKNFARADEIRDELLAKGIVLEDTREGVKWKRI